MEYGLIVKVFDVKILEDNNIDFTYWDLTDDPNSETIELNFETKQERDKASRLTKRWFDSNKLVPNA